MKLGDNLTQRSVEHNHGYWVYIPPLKKRANVEKKIAQLKERGIKDYFVVQEKGKWLNAISLGVFRTQEAAAEVYGNAAQQGCAHGQTGRARKQA